MRSASFIFPLFASLISSPCIAQSIPTPPTLEYIFTAFINVDKPLTPSGIQPLGGGIEICTFCDISYGCEAPSVNFHSICLD